MAYEFLISTHSHHVATATLDNFQAQRAIGQGLFRCYASIAGHVPDARALHLSGLSVSVSMMGPGGAWPVGRFVPTDAGIDVDLRASAGTSQQVFLEMPLRREQIEQLEEFRNGKDFGLIMTLSVMLAENGVPLRGNGQQHQISFNQSQWMAILRDLGYEERLLLELLVVAESEAPQYARAVAHMRQAQDSQFRGRYVDSINHCGKALESLQTALRDEDKVATVTKSNANDKWKRIQVVRQSLWHLMNLGRHSDEVAERIEWHREDAIAVIALTSSVLRWCAGTALHLERMSPSTQ
jgi:hypothetical protein